MLPRLEADLVRRDKKLPRLRTLLDPSTFLQAWNRHAPATAPDSAQITYVRYKPGEQCLVGYRIQRRDIDDYVYAKTVQPRHEEKSRHRHVRANSPEIDIDVPAGWNHDGLFVCPLPRDHRLRAPLRLWNPESRRRLLQRLFPGNQSLWNARVSVLNYKPERRLIAQLSVKEQPTAVLKFYSSPRFPAAIVATRGFCSSPDVRVAKRIGRSSRHGVLAFDWIEGRLLSDAISEEACPRNVVESVGAALAELHRQPGEHLVQLTAAARCREVRSTAKALAWLLPEETRRITAIARMICDDLSEQRDMPRPIHGDFYAKQVILGRESIGIIDLDQAVRASAAVDIGNYLAHVEQSRLSGGISSRYSDELHDAFLEGYRSVAASCDLRSIRTETLAALFRLAQEPFSRGNSDWGELTRGILNRIDALSGRSRGRQSDSFDERDSRGNNRGSACSSHIATCFLQDEAFPFAARVVDPGAAAAQLKCNIPQLVEETRDFVIEDVAVRRLKPGRRALVEYRLRPVHSNWRQTSPRETVILGKIRARGLDERSFRTQQQLWRNGFDEKARDGIRVPEPIGVIPDWDMWIQRRVPGITATSLLNSPGRTDIAVRIAEALFKLHSAEIPAERSHALDDEVAILRNLLPQAGKAHPQLETRINRVLQFCDRIRFCESAPRGIHRDFYPEQVLIDGSNLCILDFDLYCLGDPALDLGNFIAHLVEADLRQHGRIIHADELADQMLKRYSSLAGADYRDAVTAYTTLSLARHISLSTRFKDRRHATETVLMACEARIADC